MVQSDSGAVPHPPGNLTNDLSHQPDRGSPIAPLVLYELRMHFGGVTVLDGVSLSLSAGTVAGLIGPNGAGKTTLLNAISGVLRLAAGEIVIHGHSARGLRADRRARLGLARTYQIVRPLRNLSVLENVMVGALYGKEQRRSIKEARQRSAELIERVGLTHRRDVQATSISSGQQKLMDLARALAMEPDVLIMDEPLAALSAENQQVVLQIASEIAATGCAVLFVEHLVSAILDVAERLLVLDRGRLIADGTPDEVLRASHVLDAYLGTSGRSAVAATEAK